MSRKKMDWTKRIVPKLINVEWIETLATRYFPHLENLNEKKNVRVNEKNENKKERFALINEQMNVYL